MKPKLIVIHQDSAILRKIVQIAASGFEIVLGRTNAEAAAGLRQGKTYAILVDPGPDQVSGLELLEQVRQTHPATRRILITPADQLGPVVQGLHSGAVQAVCYQPLAARDLLAALGVGNGAVLPLVANQGMGQGARGSTSN